MPSESINLGPQPQSLETLQKTFKQRLETILNKQLTIENIETFADTAVIETIQLIEDILKEYRVNPKFNTGLIPLNKQEQEDEAFKILEIKDINKILQLIIDKKEQIDFLKEYINTNAENIDKVITPPQENNGAKIGEGAESFEKKKMFPRLLTLLYILEHDFEISPSPENVPIKEGIVTDKMMRQAPYVRVEIPEMERVAYICDEEGNASYIFDTTKLTEKGLTLEELDLEDKGDKNSLITKYPGIGVRIIQTKNWRSSIATALQETIPEIQKETIETDKTEIRSSEFRERPKWLSFEEFQEEVRSLYPSEGNILKWYKEEQKNHKNWPANPRRSYENKGWQSWSELVGKEKIIKKEWLSFDEFRNEVIKIYPGNGNVEAWYKEERKKHFYWPAEPDKTYKNNGWDDWSKFVDRENKFKKEYPSFEDFQKEVRQQHEVGIVWFSRSIFH